MHSTVVYGKRERGRGTVGEGQQSSFVQCNDSRFFFQIISLLPCCRSPEPNEGEMKGCKWIIRVPLRGSQLRGSQGRMC